MTQAQRLLNIVIEYNREARSLELQANDYRIISKRVEEGKQILREITVCPQCDEVFLNMNVICPACKTNIDSWV